MLGTSSLDNSIETVNVLIRSHTGSHTPVDDSLDNDFIANNWIIEAHKSQTLEDLAVPTSYWICRKSKRMFSSVCSFWPLKPRILAQVPMNAIKDSCAADTH